MAMATLRKTLTRRRAGPLPWLLLGAGLLLTALVTAAMLRAEQRERQRRAIELADDVGAALNNRLGSTIALLTATVGLFQASEQVTRTEFHHFFQALDLSVDTIEGIQGIGFAAVVPAGPGLDAFQKRIRADGVADFRIWSNASQEEPPSGALRDSGITAPPLTSAILFLEPQSWRNQRSIGFDMYSQPTRRLAMAMAALSGRPSLTGPVKLVQEAGSEVQVGTLVYLPVHRGGRSPGKAGRGDLSTLIGWAYAPLRMGNLLTATLSRVDNSDLRGSRVLLVDGREPRVDRRLADSSSSDPTPIPAGTVWVSQPVLDRDWSIGVVLRPSPASLLGFTPVILLTALAGTLASTAAALTASMLLANHRSTLAALKEAERASRERALAATVFESSPVGIIVTDLDGVVLTTNEAFSQISGWSCREVKGHKANILRSGRHDNAFYQNLWESIIQRGYWNGEIWNRHRNGQIRRHELSISAVLNPDNQITQFVGMLRDITDRHAEDEKIRYQALHDYLTGLPNRALLLEQLERGLALMRRQGGRVALLFMDLNGFKPVNDAHGHEVGDLLLKEVADRLLHGVRASDTVCRQGGDEFVLLVVDAGSDRDLLQLARKLQRVVARPYPGLPADVSISMSVGIACWPEHAIDADDLFRAADAAMYTAKKAGGENLFLARVLEPGGLRTSASPADARSETSGPGNRPEPSAEQG
jgi:diguanylate cyclase (GGDEF)-like protein/PAS domain S-box-containing protein